MLSYCQFWAVGAPRARRLSVSSLECSAESLLGVVANMPHDRGDRRPFICRRLVAVSLDISGYRSTKLPAMSGDLKVARVVAAGRELGIEVVPVTFPAHTRTAADAALAVGCDVGQIVKSLVFLAEDEPVLLLVSGANRVDLSQAAQALGVTRLDKADAEAARAATGYSIGATPPLGLATAMRILIDEDLLAHETVWAAAGRPDSVFAVDPQELATAISSAVARLKEGPQIGTVGGDADAARQIH